MAQGVRHLGDGLRAGEPQGKQITDMDSWWEFLNANPKELEAGEPQNDERY